jgi:uncharacterized protein YukE
MSQVHVDPDELERFAHDLNRFNIELRERVMHLQAEFAKLGDSWRDQEQSHFAKEFQQAMQKLGQLAQLTEAHIPFLLRKAQRAKEYLSLGGRDRAIGSTNRGGFGTAIRSALESGKSDRELEGMVANYVRHDLVSFQRNIEGPDGRIGEIDIETSNAIVEVTTQRSGKLKQIKKYLLLPEMNPLDKAVILFAPNYLADAAQDITNVGAYVVRSRDELVELLQKLGGL